MDIEQFQAESVKKQLQLIPELAKSGDSGLDLLREFLRSRSVPSASQELFTLNLAVGKVYQVLWQTNTPKTQEFLQTHFPNGIIPLKSERNIDYKPLQNLLIEQNFQAADSLTRLKLCELAGEAAMQRKWLYFTEVDRFPATDLNTINSLWWLYSEGKFGFSVQRQLWLSLEKDFVKLWLKIGWKKDNHWTQYPHEFTWDLSAPPGHLPLLNQLRGVQVIKSLFSHSVWSAVNFG